MPIYEYRCLACSKNFSAFSRRIDPDPAPACPACGAENPARTVSGFALHRSLKTQIEQIDPRIEKQMDAVDAARRDPLEHLNPN